MLNCHHRPSTLPGPKSYWCTGKDSNLRTSLGGADLQSAGFNHSPTCAKTPSLQSFPISLRQASPGLASARRVVWQWAVPKTRRHHAREKPVAQNTTLGKIPYGVLWEKICRAACAAQFALRSRNNAGAGEGI